MSEHINMISQDYFPMTRAIELNKQQYNKPHLMTWFKHQERARQEPFVPHVKIPLNSAAYEEIMKRSGRHPHPVHGTSDRKRRKYSSYVSRRKYKRLLRADFTPWTPGIPASSKEYTINAFLRALDVMRDKIVYAAHNEGPFLPGRSETDPAGKPLLHRTSKRFRDAMKRMKDHNPGYLMSFLIQDVPLAVRDKNRNTAATEADWSGWYAFKKSHKVPKRRLIYIDGKPYNARDVVRVSPDGPVPPRRLTNAEMAKARAILTDKTMYARYLDEYHYHSGFKHLKDAIRAVFDDPQYQAPLPLTRQRADQFLHLAHRGTAATIYTRVVAPLASI